MSSVAVNQFDQADIHHLIDHRGILRMCFLYTIRGKGRQVEPEKTFYNYLAMLNDIACQFLE